MAKHHTITAVIVGGLMLAATTFASPASAQFCDGYFHLGQDKREEEFCARQRQMEMQLTEQQRQINDLKSEMQRQQLINSFGWNR
jgi:hypothetical protein